MGRALGAALLACALAAVPAQAAQTQAQKLFRSKLLASSAVSKSVKVTLKKGGFVDRRILFEDLTGEGKADAVVMVHSGGSAGRIALYVFSAGTGTNLRIVYRNQRLYRARVRLQDPAQFVYSVPRHKPGDHLCCPSQTRETTLGWRAETRRFVVTGRRTVDAER